jgi:hypothetical protein
MVTLEFKTLLLRNGLKLDYKTQLTEIVRNVTPPMPRRAHEDSRPRYDRG